VIGLFQKFRYGGHPRLMLKVGLVTMDKVRAPRILLRVVAVRALQARFSMYVPGLFIYTRLDKVKLRLFDPLITIDPSRISTHFSHRAIIKQLGRDLIDISKNVALTTGLGDRHLLILSMTLSTRLVGVIAILSNEVGIVTWSTDPLEVLGGAIVCGPLDVGVYSLRGNGKGIYSYKKKANKELSKLRNELRSALYTTSHFNHLKRLDFSTYSKS
jgi:hypothetical protein